eukprot:5863179-Prymnesium_polylepis.1
MSGQSCISSTSLVCTPRSRPPETRRSFALGASEVAPLTPPFCACAPLDTDVSCHSAFGHFGSRRFQKPAHKSYRVCPRRDAFRRARGSAASRLAASGRTPWAAVSCGSWRFAPVCARAWVLQRRGRLRPDPTRRPSTRLSPPSRARSHASRRSWANCTRCSPRALSGTRRTLRPSPS